MKYQSEEQGIELGILEEKRLERLASALLSSTDELGLCRMTGLQPDEIERLLVSIVFSSLMNNQNNWGFWLSQHPYSSMVTAFFRVHEKNYCSEKGQALH